MKKALLTTILLCAVAVTATAQRELSVPTAAGIKGPVHVVQATRWYDYEGQDVWPLTWSDAYGRDGLLMYEIYSTEWGDVEKTYYWKDKQGRLTDLIYYGTGKGYHYIYSDDGRLLFIINDAHDKGDKDDTLLVTKYDGQGRTLELSSNDKTKYRYTYYPDGQLFSAEQVDAWTRYYNRQGLEDSTRQYYGFERHVYNEHGDEIEQIIINNATGDTVTVRYNYGADRDRYGNWLSMDFERDGIHYYVRRHIIYYEEKK